MSASRPASSRPQAKVDAKADAKAKFKPAPPLPRGGRHALTQQAVADSQQRRMLMAVASAVKQHGYAATTVAHVIALAGVSRRTFYEQFAGIEACFLAAYEDGARRLLDATRAALVGVAAAGWRERSRLAVTAYLRELANEPDAAWVYSVDVMGAGPAALGKRDWVLAQWVAQWRAVLALRDGERAAAGVRATDATNAADTISDATLLALVGGLEELVRDCLGKRGAAALPDIAPDMLAYALRVIGD